MTVGAVGVDNDAAPAVVICCTASYDGGSRRVSDCIASIASLEIVVVGTRWGE